MDLLRIFLNTSFARIAERYFEMPEHIKHNAGRLMFDETGFVDECRCHNPELSDDQMRMIYRIYRDEWSARLDSNRFLNLKEKPEIPIIQKGKNIFNAVFRFCGDIFRLQNGQPTVKFNFLFRWRETAQACGEDLFACAYMAYMHKDDVHPAPEGIKQKEVSLDWPTVLHNDNNQLRHLFQKRKINELHSHLFASTDIFSISWVSLMNDIAGRKDKFSTLADIQDKSRSQSIAHKQWKNAKDACQLRITLWKFLQTKQMKLLQDINEKDEDELNRELEGERYPDFEYDYVPGNPDSILHVIYGERKFLYESFLYILHDDNEVFERLFYSYVLRKNLLRRFLVQINDNRGFANFKRFQDLKSILMSTKYKRMVARLAIEEAVATNYVDHMETRITPTDKKEIKKLLKSIPADTEDDLHAHFSLIFHFIKKADICLDFRVVRDSKIREDVYTQSGILKDLKELDEAFSKKLIGIDAASSEIACRPECFGQAFRYLKKCGYNATFHAGEDFYDIADGLRAISEAILFLGLESGDRIGHAIVLGIDVEEFYNERHGYIALPRQWMLDNVVWLYYKSRFYNISIDPATELFFTDVFRKLIREIGYDTSCTIEDYYKSMCLRGDNPNIYVGSGDGDGTSVNDDWRYYDIVDNQIVDEIRRFNSDAREIHIKYLYNPDIKQNGNIVNSFKITYGYMELLKHLQVVMIKEISKRRLGIECCPSSNVRIGRISRFDLHPIFKFCPVIDTTSRYHLDVTVNTDDLGVFATSLPNEYSLLALALLKKKDKDGNHLYSTREVYDWIDRIITNSHIYTFSN